MARRACTFKESDLRRALRAARSAGVQVRIEIEHGKIIVVPLDDKVGDRKQVSDEVESWLEKHAHRR
jgi:hypothetical protein